MYKIIEVIEDWIYAILSFAFAGTGSAIGGIKHMVAAQATPPEWFTNCAPYFQIFAWVSAGVLAVVGIVVNINKIIDRCYDKKYNRGLSRNNNKSEEND